MLKNKDLLVDPKSITTNLIARRAEVCRCRLTTKNDPGSKRVPAVWSLGYQWQCSEHRQYAKTPALVLPLLSTQQSS